MSPQLKKDLITIIEVSSFILIQYSYHFLPEAVVNILSAAWLIAFLYSWFYKKTSSNVLLLPTVKNDRAGNMKSMFLGVIVFIISFMGFFVFQIKPYYAVVGLILSIYILFFMKFYSWSGWIHIKGNILKISGIKEKFYSHKLKQIILANDKITLIDVYDRNEYCYNLQLDTVIATRIKEFLSSKLTGKEFVIIDNVTD